MNAAGDRLGPYRILSPLGAGGMGEVYLAEDTRLRRQVALKVLPPSTTDDEVSRKRLLREAQTAATLEHPNICTVYDVGEDGGQSYIAMQYVEGETLAERLRRGPIDLRTATAIGAQTAAALAEAHRRDIIHRDVKPQNIMLTADGRVKVLDFGLAKLTTPVAHDAETTGLVTGVGVVVGTIPYMSPEQIRAEPLDVRTDVFSLGCVLYEMIGRVNPFLAASSVETLSAVLSREVAPLPAAVPAELQRIVRKCLEKDRERRYQSMRDVAIDLEIAGRELSAPARSAAEPRLRRPAIALAGVLVAGAIAAGYLYLRSGRVASASIPAAEFVQITALPDAASAPAISPDGRMVAFIRGDWFLATGDVYIKMLPDGDPVQLTHDGRPKYGPTFTPDGSRVAYTVVDGLGTATTSWDTWSVPVLGGEPRLLLRNAAGLTWIDDHHVLFSEIESGTGLHMGIVTAGEDRQNERRVYFPEENRAMAHFSYLSPDRRWVLVVEMDRTASFGACRVVPFDGGPSARTVGPLGSCTSAGWSKDGRWMYFSVVVDGAAHLWRQRFPDGRPGQITTDPATEEQGIAMAPDGRSLMTSVGQEPSTLWVHDASGERLLPLDGSVSEPHLSRDRTHVYCLQRRIGDPFAHGVTIVDLSTGKTERILTEFSIDDFDISGDDRLAAVTVLADRGRHEIWLAPLDRREPPRRIVADGDEVKFGRSGEIVYRSLTGTSNTLRRVTADGSGGTQIYDKPILELDKVTPDGAWAVVRTPVTTAASSGETLAVPVHGSAAARTLCEGICLMRWAPDGSSASVVTIDGAQHLRLVTYPLAPGKSLPDLGPARAAEGFHGVPAEGVEVGNDPSFFIYSKLEQRGNLFRIPLQ